MESIRREEKTRVLSDVLAEAEATPLLTPVEASEAGVKAKQGERPNNVRPSGYGNSQSYIAKRLARDRVDLLERVKSGDLSLHAARIEAGFVSDEFSCPKDPAKAAQRIRRHFTGDRLVRLVMAQTGANEKAVRGLISGSAA